MDSAGIPLIIGITGHRELYADDRDRLEKQIRRKFAKLRANYPHTPLLLLSSLGEGADRLAAKVAVETEGVSLAAVLPWPEGVCDADWHRGGDREEFEALLDRAEHRICLLQRAGLTAERLCESEEEKQKCFAEVSRYITRHSQVLIAVWNGKEDEGSQTWQVICWHMEGTPAPFAAKVGHLDEPETGPLIHLPVRREGDSAPPLSTAPKERLPETFAKGFHGIAAAFERFNTDATEFGPELIDGIKTAKGYVIPEKEQVELAVHQRFALDRFAMADQLSLRYQGRSHTLLLCVLGLILLTVASFEIYAHALPGRWEILLAYPALFIVGLVFVRRAKRKGTYNRYLDYRAIAEAMRVHLFWKIAGTPGAASDFYLRTYRSQLDWIRAALRAWTVQSGEHDCRCDFGAKPEPEKRGALDKVRERWMADQHRYFTKTAGPRNEEKATLWKWVARGFLFASLGVASYQIIRLFQAHQHHEHLGHDHLTHYLIVAIALLGVIAGLCHEYSEKRLYEKQARSYEWMSSLYGTALKRFDALKADKDLDEATKTSATQELILDLGREALAENADWVIYHREHEPEMKGH